MHIFGESIRDAAQLIAGRGAVLGLVLAASAGGGPQPGLTPCRRRARARLHTLA